MRASISTPVGPVVDTVEVIRTPPETIAGLDVNVGEREGMAHGDEIGSAFGGLDSGEASDLERIAFGVRRQSRENGGGKLHEGGCACGAVSGLLAAHVDHGGVAGRGEMREAFLFGSGHLALLMTVSHSWVGKLEKSFPRG